MFGLSRPTSAQAAEKPRERGYWFSTLSVTRRERRAYYRCAGGPVNGPFGTDASHGRCFTSRLGIS
jgi:hypothetical protein